jgi:RNA-dependent RNA polymerase
MDGTQAQEGSAGPPADNGEGHHGPAPRDNNEPGGSSIEVPIEADVIARLARLRAEPREARPVLILPNRTQQIEEQNRFQSRYNIPRGNNSYRGNANARGNLNNRGNVNNRGNLNNRGNVNNRGNFNNQPSNRGGLNSFQRNTQPFRHNNQQPRYQQQDNRTMNRPGAFQTTALVADWSQYRSVLLTLRGVPRNATTWDLYNSLSPIGNIGWIAIEEDRRGERSSEAASIRFEPPPTDRILPGTSIQIKVGQRAVWVMVAATVPTRNEGAVRSPLGQNLSAKVILKPTKLSFGITMEPNVVMNMRSVQSLGLPDDFVLTMDFHRRRVTLDFPVLTKDAAHPELDTCQCFYRMETKIDTLRKVYRVCNDNTKAVVLTLDSPPRFYRRKNDIEQTHASGKLEWTDQELWSRIVDILHDPAESSTTPSSLENNHYEIDLGRWTTYWFELDDAAQREWAIIESALQDWNIKTKHDDTMKLVPRAEPQLWSWLEDATTTADNTALLASAPRITLPFDVRYQLEVCISHDVFEARNITREFLVKLAGLADTRTMSSNRARLVLEYAADQNKRIWDPMSLFNDRAALTFYPTTANIPHYCALVRKVTVTPTRIYFHSPTVETTNRVIRHFKQEENFFLRVQFMDELNEGRINGSDTIRDNELYIRAFRLLNNGIKMGRWQWNFLAFGNSQIRENGAFFFCEPVGAPNDSITCDKIRAWMGRFSHIKVAAKYAARLGQCFSTTRLLRGIPAPTIVNIPDVERGDHCFTDGVGKMSPLLAQMIAEDWQLDAVPSACQFRMGGCKGVLVAWPEAKGIEVHIRKSQEKFHSEFNGLEIIRFSSFSVATLNRQTITILTSLGVPDQVFVDLLQQQLTNYNRAMTDRAYAVQLLQQYVDENQVTVGIARMLLDGFMETREPFVMAMMQLWKSWSIKGLKEKARIVVDDGAFVIGCVDETRTLKGHIEKKRRRDARPVDELPEIFLQVSDPKDRGSLRIITGVCLVGRNPSLHPGDIRVVKAVDVPALRHLTDVVVFPMQGDQDIPSMCSGGDLDGDDYFVIWNQDMIPTQWFHPPMDYTPPPPLELDRDPNVMDLKVFFSLYMKNFSLPIIAHAHLAQADFMDSGAKDPRCEYSLSILFPTVLSFIANYDYRY